MSIGIVWPTATAFAVDKNAIQSHLESILLALDYPGTVKIEVALVSDREIKALNQKHRHINKPTDILSFNAVMDANQDLLGTLVISIETAAKQAKQAGIEISTELKMLAGHGLLHLLGYHHK